jgi:uncharacterized protein YgbK (DUF1537 family)
MPCSPEAIVERLVGPSNLPDTAAKTGLGPYCVGGAICACQTTTSLMTKLRLVADDLTGALDSGARFSGAGRVVPVYLSHRLPAVFPGEFALDCASRELDSTAAAAIAARTAHILSPASGTISFKKVDSLLRGNPGSELAAVLRAIPRARCVIAPAFPFHGRVTRAGLQFVRQGGAWERTGQDLRATLESQGIEAPLLKPGDCVPAGTSLWDCETDDDLLEIARSVGRLSEPVLWCGSGGLAAALAPLAGSLIPAREIGRPLLGVFGSDHPVTAAQLRECGEDVVRLRDFGPENSKLISERLASAGVCHVRLDLPSGLGRSEASARIAREIERLAREIPRPASLLVVGGETLRSLCVALGTDHLEVAGQLMPGVPVSRMVGGRWGGIGVISKSGAFGGARLLLEIIPPAERWGPGARGQMDRLA